MKRALVQLDVGKCLLHEALAIIECAGHFERGDIFAESGELFFLSLADALRRIKNHDTNSRHAEKPMRHGAASVTRSRDKYSERPRLARAERHGGPVARHVTHDLSLGQKEGNVLRLAQPLGALHNRLEDGLQIVGRPADDSQDFAGRLLLLQRLVELPLDRRDVRLGDGDANARRGTACRFPCSGSCLPPPRFHCLACVSTWTGSVN